MEKEPLVPGRDVQQVAYFGAGQPAEVAQRDDDPLAVRELTDRRHERRAGLALDQPALGVVLVRDNLFAKRREGKAPCLPHAAILREVGHDRTAIP
jgi:hypothetical protein